LTGCKAVGLHTAAEAELGHLELRGWRSRAVGAAHSSENGNSARDDRLFGKGEVYLHVDRGDGGGGHELPFLDGIHGGLR
jgi:hypothetical protein